MRTCFTYTILLEPQSRGILGVSFFCFIKNIFYETKTLRNFVEGN